MLPNIREVRVNECIVCKAPLPNGKSHLYGYYFCDSCNTKYVKVQALGELKDQSVKADAGKPKLTLVPRQIIFDIAEVREYGNKKYGDPESWKGVEVERYRDAAFRHFMAYLNDPQGADEESGIEHLKHLACNIAFLCELESTTIG